MMVQRLQTDHAHEPEPGNAQRSRWSSSSMSIRPAPYEPMACETTKDHVNVTWVCEVMWVSCVAYTQSNGGHMIFHTSIMFCASRLFPSWLQPRFWNLLKTELIDNTFQALLVAKQGSGNVVKVRNGPWLKSLWVACEVDFLSLYNTVHRNRPSWKYSSLTTSDLAGGTM